MLRVSTELGLKGILRQRSITVSSTRQLIEYLPDTKIMLVQNVSQNDVFFGNSSVTTANGLKIAPGETVPFYVSMGLEIYLVAQNNAEVRVMEVG